MERQERLWHLRIYEVLLLIYPRRFRERYGREMTYLFADRYREERSPGRRSALWIATVWDVFRNGLSERASLPEGRGPFSRRGSASIGCLRIRHRRNSVFVRDCVVPRCVHELVQDVSVGIRVLRSSPLSSSIAAASLALAIGANTTVFTVIDAILVRPLPYADSERLVSINEGATWGTADAVPLAHFVDWRARSQLLDAVVAYDHSPVTVTGSGEPERLRAVLASSNLLPTLGTTPVLGRNFLASEEREGGEAVAILSHELWRRRFGADGGVIGRQVTIDQRSTRIVGVLRPEFRFFVPGEIWLPLTIDQGDLRRPRQRLVYALGRLSPRAELKSTAAELEVIREASSVDIPPRESQERVQVTRLHERLAGGERHVLGLLSGASALILLLACANLGNLALARGAARSKDLGTRVALGAPRSRVMRELVAEGLVLGLVGGASGVVVAWAATRLLVVFRPPLAFGAMESISSVGIDARTLAFTGVISLASGFLSGLVPAVRLSRPDTISEVLQSGAVGTTLRATRMRPVLLVSQVAFAIVLLFGAGLLLRSAEKIVRLDVGFHPADLLTFRLTLSEPRYRDPALRAQFQQRVLDRLAALPGVERVASGDHLPLTGFRLLVGISREDHPSGESSTFTPLGLVSSDYFRTLGIELLAGRHFDVRDDRTGERAVILSESMAKRLFPGEDPLDKEVALPIREPFALNPGQAPPRVVGIVADVRNEDLTTEARPTIYAPYQQIPLGDWMIALRSEAAPESLVAAVRREVQSIDPDQPIYDVLTMEERLSNSLGQRRFTLFALGGIALLALVIAVTGVYSGVAQLVSQRRHEIGVRMALGATTATIRRMFVKEGMTLVVWGTVVGMGVALVARGAIRRELFGITALDPLSFALAVGCVVCTALTACWVPAERATRVHASETLRGG